MRAHRRPDRKSARAASHGARPPSVSGDVAAYLACVLDALLALALVRRWGRHLPRRLLLACAWAGCALLILHSVPTLVGEGLMAAGLRTSDLSAPERWSLFVYEPWFFAGGVLYGAAVCGYGRRSREQRAEPGPIPQSPESWKG